MLDAARRASRRPSALQVAPSCDSAMTSSTPAAQAQFVTNAFFATFFADGESVGNETGLVTWKSF